MKKYSDLEYLQLSKWERFQYKFLSFFAAIPVCLIDEAFVYRDRYFRKNDCCPSG